MLKALVYIVPVALAVFALIEMSRSSEPERLGLSPWAWAAIIVLLPVVGPLVWIVLSRRVTSGQRPAGPTQRPRPPRRTGPVAPDDDPDFLWRLEQQQRRRQTGPAGTGPAPDEGAGEGDGSGTADPGQGDGTSSPDGPDGTPGRDER